MRSSLFLGISWYKYPSPSNLHPPFHSNEGEEAKHLRVGWYIWFLFWRRPGDLFSHKQLSEVSFFFYIIFTYCKKVWKISHFLYFDGFPYLFFYKNIYSSSQPETVLCVLGEDNQSRAWWPRLTGMRRTINHQDKNQNIWHNWFRYVYQHKATIFHLIGTG